MTKPLAIDLFCGLGGWTDGLLAEGYDVIGFDIEEHAYGDQRYPGMLCIQDVRTLHGSQFKDAALIVASPPCQEYSYMAMPWSLAKAKAKAIRDDTTGQKLAALNDLFNQCFRIQKEASFAAGRHIPMVVENVRGATPWVGRARWNFGSFYLWGDVPALMPMTFKAAKVPGFRFDGSGKTFQTASVEGMKTVGHANKRDGHTHTRHLTNQREHNGLKVPGMNWSGHGKPGYKPKGFNVTAAQRYREDAGIKNGGDWFGSGADQSLQRHYSGTKQPGIGGKRANGKGDAWFQDGAAAHGSRSNSRKAASAMIAKIPLPLSRHIGATYRPQTV